MGDTKGAQRIADLLCEFYGQTAIGIGGDKYKLFTTGKMLDRSVNIDGLFNYLLYAEKIVNDEEVTYKFRTKSLGPDTCRSTTGCFSDLYIEPNMKMVIDTINKFELGE